MWDYVPLPQEANAPAEREKLIEQFAIEKMQEYDGTIFHLYEPPFCERHRRGYETWVLSPVI